jgi:kynurenine formamidase
MCHACVIDSVRDRMLSRRDLLRAAPAAAVAAATAAAVAPLSARAAGDRVADLTHAYDGDFPTYFGAPGVSFDQKFSWAEHKFNLFELTVNEHTGTHIDAPLHFSENGDSVDAIPVERLVAPLCVVDIRARAEADADAQVTPDDLTAWIAAHGPIPDGACVAMLSGWAAHVGGPKFRNADADGKMHFPGFHIEAARMLLEETGAGSIGVDTLSLDHGPSADFAVHYAWLPTNRFGIECMANLEALPPAGATLIAGAPKHRGGSGGPARLLALV